MLPDFNRLRVFYHIYAHLSIKLASEELNITQSAVSQHLNKLESELKTHLFTRLHKKLIPTAAGTRLFGTVKPLVDDIRKSIDTIQHAQEVPSGLLRVGAPVELGKEYFPAIFASFRQIYPEVIFILKLGDTETLLPSISEGELDFAFVDTFSLKHADSGQYGPYGIESIIEEEVILACSKRYFHSHKFDPLTYRNLIGKEFISYNRHDLAIRSWFKHHFNKTPAHFNTVLIVDSLQAVLMGIVHHLGLGIIASHFAWEAISQGEIIPITTEKKNMMNRISLVQLLNKVPSLTEKTFLAHFRDQIHSTEMFKKISISTLSNSDGK